MPEGNNVAVNGNVTEVPSAGTASRGVGLEMCTPNCANAWTGDASRTETTAMDAVLFMDSPFEGEQVSGKTVSAISPNRVAAGGKVAR